MVDIPQPLIFLGILLIIPLQIYLSPNRTSDLDYYVANLKTKFTKIWDKLVSLSTDNDDVIVEKSEAGIIDEDKVDEDEIEKGYFTSDLTPRDPRPPHIKFSVGDVIYHKLNKYRAVIIGWDEKAKAPELWLTKIRGSKADRNDYETNYAVLIDTRTHIIPQLGYVLEKNIEKSEGKIFHPLLEKYFERYQRDKGTYQLRPWLREVYPND